MFDTAPIGKSFGTVQADVNSGTPYHAGQIVSAKFVGANPRVIQQLLSKKFL